jgi:hypothetical protein
VTNPALATLALTTLALTTLAQRSAGRRAHSVTAGYCSCFTRWRLALFGSMSLPTSLAVSPPMCSLIAFADWSAQG